MKELPYWIDVFPLDNFIPHADLPEQCEVAVIGGGLTGLSTALHVARKGAEVVVLEQATLGWGASTRNAGMALTGLKLSPEELVQRHGRGCAQRLYRSSLEALNFVENLISSEKIDCDFQRCGDLCAAFRPSHFDGLRASQKFLQEEFNQATLLVSPAEMKQELGSTYYHGGLIDPLSAGLNPAKLVAGLAQAAARANVKLFEKNGVKNCRREKNGFVLETIRGRIRAKEVVVATNGYTPLALGRLRRRVIPIGSYIIVTEPLPSPLAEDLMPGNRMVYDTKNFLFYFRLTPDRRLLFGGRTSFIPTTDRSAAQILQVGMCRVFPQLEKIKVDYAWHGNVAFTFDQLPHLGVDDGIHYAMGYCGHGVVMSVYFGSRLASMLSGEVCALPFTSLPFPARFFYRRRPWFLPIAGGYFKVKDWLF